jgi:hypothetical protein
LRLASIREGVAGGGDEGGDDSDDSDDGEDEKEVPRDANPPSKPYIREANYPSYRGPVDYYRVGMADTVVKLKRVNPASEARSTTD